MMIPANMQSPSGLEAEFGAAKIVSLGGGVPGPKGEPFRYEDFTAEQLEALRGPVGQTPNLNIGTVTTLEAGSNATASIGGTAENPLLNLGIPKGADGSGGGDAWEFVDEVALRTDTLQYNWAKTKDYKKLMLICDDRTYNAALTGTIWFNAINNSSCRSLCSFAKQVKSVFVYQFEHGLLSYSNYETNNAQTFAALSFSERAYLPDYVITDNDYYSTTFPASALDGTGTVKVFGVRR